jgi:hypothetical protein
MMRRLFAVTAARTVARTCADKPGRFAVSRLDPGTGREVHLAFNTANNAAIGAVAIETASSRFALLAGQCPPAASAPGNVVIALPPPGFAVCAAQPDKD